MRQRIISLLHEQIRAGLHPGSRLYVSQESEILLDLCAGEASTGVPMTHDTSLLWMSAGKPITALAIMQQVEKGCLNLDERVSTYLPAFGIKGKEAITVRHILTHTGGFRLADKVDVATWDQALAEIYSTPLEPNWTVGLKAGYHIGGSWLILGEIVRQLDGRSISHYLQKEIFLPAGMTGCSLGLDDPGRKHSVMYLTDGGHGIPHPLLAQEARLKQWRTGSNLMGSAQALGRFYEVLLKGGSPLVQPETVRMMTQRQRKGVFDQTFRHIIDFGLGFIINSSAYGPLTVPYGYGRHSSTESFGHGGNQSSIAFADPLHQLVLVYITNGMPGETAHQKRMRTLIETL
jgi:CubicO group peptidase (beta-lactamase class C family)